MPFPFAFPNTNSGAAYDALAVTPSDIVNLTTPARALYVGGTGNIVLITHGGNQVTFSNVQAGSVLSVSVTRVLATNTTATGIIALY